MHIGYSRLHEEIQEANEAKHFFNNSFYAGIIAGLIFVSAIITLIFF